MERTDGNWVEISTLSEERRDGIRTFVLDVLDVPDDGDSRGAGDGVVLLGHDEGGGGGWGQLTS